LKIIVVSCVFFFFWGRCSDSPGGRKEALIFGDGIWNCSLVWCFESVMIMSRGDFFFDSIITSCVLDKFGVLGLGFWVLQVGRGLREDGASFVVVFDIYYGVARSSSVARGSL
jgi:hypothetical protein